MALADLTDPAAVDAAIAEYDTLGREAFLAKYRFGKGRWMVIHDGNSYDSKAIVGAAHGFQHPSEGPLTWQEFSGGLNTTVAKLKSLGYDVQNPSQSRTVLLRSHSPRTTVPCSTNTRKSCLSRIQMFRRTTGRSSRRSGRDSRPPGPGLLRTPTWRCRSSLIPVFTPRMDDRLRICGVVLLRRPSRTNPTVSKLPSSSRRTERRCASVWALERRP